jgi:hypothetical protein
MPPTRDAWREDPLGLTIRAALAGARRAEPSATVFSRLARAVEPAGPRRLRLVPWAYAGAALGAVLLFSVALGTHSATLQSRGAYTSWSGTEQPVAVEGLTPDELAVQSRYHPRSVGLSMPPGAMPWWRYAQSGLPRPARGGAEAATGSDNGQRRAQAASRPASGSARPLPGLFVR